MSSLGRSPQESTNDASGRVAALVLAAGGGARFVGGTKQLASLDGRPLVAHAVAVARAGGVDRTVVVVGHDAAAVAAAARTEDPDVEVVHNPAHETGQASSLRAGISHLAAEPSIRVVVVLLADQPGIDAAVVRDVLAAVGGAFRAARARYADGPGHPVAFSHELFARLADVDGDVGARKLFAELEVALVPVAGHAPRDVDTSEDLAAVRQHWDRPRADADQEDT